MASYRALPTASGPLAHGDAPERPRPSRCAARRMPQATDGMVGRHGPASAIATSSVGRLACGTRRRPGPECPGPAKGRERLHRGGRTFAPDNHEGVPPRRVNGRLRPMGAAATGLLVA